VTIAGDTAQRLVFDNNFSGWADLLAQLRGGRGGRGEGPGAAATEQAIVRPLRLSYRSTAEVMMLAREILGPELAPEEPLAARPGEPVELHEFGDLGEAIAFLGDALRNLMAREPTASCAVIARHPEQADAYFEGLRHAEVPALRRVRRDEFNFQPGVDTTDIHRHGRRQRRELPRSALGSPHAPHRRDARRTSALVDRHRRAQPADPRSASRRGTHGDHLTQPRV
jgi:DNA helicase-2/ATP-dependent DNA helicase PcrA